MLHGQWNPEWEVEMHPIKYPVKRWCIPWNILPSNTPEEHNWTKQKSEIQTQENVKWILKINYTVFSRLKKGVGIGGGGWGGAQKENEAIIGDLTFKNTERKRRRKNMEKKRKKNTVKFSGDSHSPNVDSYSQSPTCWLLQSPTCWRLQVLTHLLTATANCPHVQIKQRVTLDPLTQPATHLITATANCPPVSI